MLGTTCIAQAPLWAAVTWHFVTARVNININGEESNVPKTRWNRLCNGPKHHRKTSNRQWKRSKLFLFILFPISRSIMYDRYISTQTLTFALLHNVTLLQLTKQLGLPVSELWNYTNLLYTRVKVFLQNTFPLRVICILVQIKQKYPTGMQGIPLFLG